MANTSEVKDNSQEKRFEIDVDGNLAVAEYQLEPDCIRFTHTVVPPELSGRGIGSRLAQACLKSAKDRELKVIPQCSFIAGYMKKHPEFQDLIHEDHRGLLDA
jgi:predicted GNAT family acetyltransferase